MTNSETIQDSAKDLAKAHWKFVKECLDKFANYDATYHHDYLVDDMAWAFEHGFVHGFKHGKEDNK